MNRRKRKDYASDDNIFKNFDEVASASQGMLTAREYADVQVIMKTARIQNLRGRAAVNESVTDSYLDRAVYSILAYGLALREAE